MQMLFYEHPIDFNNRNHPMHPTGGLGLAKSSPSFFNNLFKAEHATEQPENIFKKCR